MGDRVRGRAASRARAGQSGSRRLVTTASGARELRCWRHELPHGRPCRTRHPRRRARGAEDALGCGAGDRHGGQPAPVPTGRRAGAPQVREPPADRFVQAARRLRPDRRSAARAAGRRRGRGERGQPRAGRGAGVVAARGARDGVHAEGCPAAQDQRDPRLRRRGAAARPGGRRDAGRRAGVRRADGRGVHPPFDHPDVIAGQGTVGLEILEQCPEVRTVVVGIGGEGWRPGSRSR